MDLFGTNNKPAPDNQINVIDGERSPASINESVSISKKLTSVFMIVCAAILLLFLGWRYFSNRADERRLAQEEATKVDQSQKVEQALPALKVPAPPAAAPVVVTSNTPTDKSPSPAGPVPSIYAPPPSPAKKELTPEELAWQRKMNSPVSLPLEVNLMASRAGEDGQLTTTSDNDLAASLVGTSTPRAQASNLGDRNFLLTKGTFLEGVLETAMSSDVPGMIKALVTSDVYSSNGKVVLLERGTRLIGEFTGQLRNGQSRVFVLWTRAETPDGIVINLNSGSADELGRSGMDGYVDHHWGLRLGAAFLLSTWSDAMQIVIDSQRNTSGDNNYITYDNSSRAAQDMASEALRGYINIPPTLYKNQGDPIRIFVARDLDFSSVYKLAASEKASSHSVASPSPSQLKVVPLAGNPRDAAPPQYYVTDLPPCPESSQAKGTTPR